MLPALSPAFCYADLVKYKPQSSTSTVCWAELEQGSPVHWQCHPLNIPLPPPVGILNGLLTSVPSVSKSSVFQHRFLLPCVFPSIT